MVVPFNTRGVAVSRTAKAWALFGVLALIWGSSYLLMRVAVVEMPPAQVTLMRVGIAALCTNALVLLLGKRYPTDRKTLVALVIIGLGNSALPFTLLAWGEQTVESGLTSVIQAITPLFAIVIAHYTFEDERITPYKIAGIVVGFSGIIALSLGESFGGKLGGQIAIVIASICYAATINYIRKVMRSRMEPLVMSAVTMIAASIGAVLMMVAAPLIGERGPVAFSSVSSDVLWSGLALGFLNTFIAYLIYYRIIADLGASRTSMITYAVPPVAVLLGAVLLHEHIDERLLVGGVLILAGIVLVNLGPFRRHKSIAAPKETVPQEHVV